MDSTERGHPWRRLLAWLPVVIAVLVMASASAAVAALPAPDTSAPMLSDTRPGTPIVDVRRFLPPLADEVAEVRLVAALDEFVTTLPPDTCVTVRVGEVSYRHRGDDPQAPASAQKLLTAVAALSALGPDTTYGTPVLATAPLVGGVIAGDLFLVGVGDPLLATPAYAARYTNQPQVFTDITVLADGLVAAGVARVEGGVVGVDERYDRVRYHPAWPPRFITQDQTGPLSALAVNDGFQTWPARGSEPVTPAEDPAVLGAEVLTSLLVERGVEVVGAPRSGAAPDPAAATELARVTSPPMRDVVGQFLAESDNATAELVLKELGLRVRGAGTFADGAAAIAAILDGAGLGRAETVVVDGSGLSDGDTVTCDLLVDTLDHEPTASQVRDGLAVAGRSGTLSRRWIGTPLEGRVRAKTGTLNQVTALAGVVDTDGAGPARFALLVNVEAPARIQREAVLAQQILAEVLVAHPSRPDLSGFEPGSEGGSGS